VEEVVVGKPKRGCVHVEKVEEEKEVELKVWCPHSCVHFHVYVPQVLQLISSKKFALIPNRN
jgi:hypothetical protein